VHTQALRVLLLPAGQPPPDRALHDAVQLVPAQTEVSGNRRNAGIPEPVNHQCLEKRGEAGTGFGPGNAYLVHSMPVAVAARNLHRQNRAVLAGIEMPPPAQAEIVTGCLCRTLRADQWNGWIMPDMNGNLTLIHAELD